MGEHIVQGWYWWLNSWHCSYSIRIESIYLIGAILAQTIKPSLLSEYNLCIFLTVSSSGSPPDQTTLVIFVDETGTHRYKVKYSIFYREVNYNVIKMTYFERVLKGMEVFGLPVLQPICIVRLEIISGNPWYISSWSCKIRSKLVFSHWLAAFYFQTVNTSYSV